MERLSVCLRVLCERSEVVGGVFGEKSRQVLADMLSLTKQEAPTGKVGVHCVDFFLPLTFFP